MHTDPIAARRTQAGAPVVHGINAALWAIESLLISGHVTHAVTGLEVRFQRYIYLDTEVIVRLTSESDTSLRAELLADGLVATAVTLRFATQQERTETFRSAEFTELPSAPRALDMADIKGRAGILPPPRNAPSSLLFPHSARFFGPDAVAEIAQLSPLVGMVCPGLYSIFSGLTIEFIECGQAPGLSFKVRDVDERFRTTLLAISGRGISGTLSVFARKPPPRQASLQDLQDVVRAGEFSRITALIIGGSRGLGSLTARIIVSGGGRVVITYVVGEIEAREMAEDIGSEYCSILRYDITAPAAEQLTNLQWKITQLYYFATPAIFRQNSRLYVSERFAEFCQFYVDGFERICNALRARDALPLTVFYPSSVAIDDRPKGMTEYSMSKAAGEILCEYINRSWHGMRVVVQRLPRILTDQTSTIIQVPTNDAVEVMLPIIRQMYGE